VETSSPNNYINLIVKKKSDIQYFSKGMWQWLHHYGTVLNTVHCMGICYICNTVQNV